VLTAEFQKTGDDPETDSAIGTLTLYVDTQAVASAEITTQPGTFSLAGDGLCIGRDSGSAVTPPHSTSSAAQSNASSSMSAGIVTSTTKRKSSPT
jgi:hypothetical protein